MPNLDVSSLTNDLQPTGAWAKALLHALARDEAAGRRPQRLTEPRLATWSRFRGRLTTVDLLALLFEDAAVLHRVPFDPGALGGPIQIDRLPDSVAEAWVATLQSTHQPSSIDYVGEQARLLGVPARMARSDLHAVKPHQKVLELPGTGGQLAHHLVSNHRDLTLQENFVLACGSWQELTLAGVIALDLGAPHTHFVVKVEPGDLRDTAHPLRQRSFDFVIGLHPDKGGLYCVQDQLAIWFPHAKILLV
jgi:hypothetical protein